VTFSTKISYYIQREHSETSHLARLRVARLYSEKYIVFEARGVPKLERSFINPSASDSGGIAKWPCSTGNTPRPSNVIQHNPNTPWDDGSGYHVTSLMHEGRRAMLPQMLSAGNRRFDITRIQTSYLVFYHSLRGSSSPHDTPLRMSLDATLAAPRVRPANNPPTFRKRPEYPITSNVSVEQTKT